MQDYSYIYVPVIVLTNTGFTPCSHNTKQRRNASGQFLRVGYSYYKQNTTLFFASCLFRFASVKSTITRFLLRISKVKTVNLEH